jgi:F0F1-type ATP synthase assembly protein I
VDLSLLDNRKEKIMADFIVGCLIGFVIGFIVAVISGDDNNIGKW